MIRRLLAATAAIAAMSGAMLLADTSTASAAGVCDVLNLQIGVNNPNPNALLCGPHAPTPPSPCGGSLLGLQVGTNPTDPYLVCV